MASELGRMNPSSSLLQHKQDIPPKLYTYIASFCTLCSVEMETSWNNMLVHHNNPRLVLGSSPSQITSCERFKVEEHSTQLEIRTFSLYLIFFPERGTHNAFLGLGALNALTDCFLRTTLFHNSKQTLRCQLPFSMNQRPDHTLSSATPIVISVAITLRHEEKHSSGRPEI